MPDVTERLEGISARTAKPAGTDPEQIFKDATELPNSPAVYQEMSLRYTPHGNGQGCQGIVSIFDAQ